MWFLIHRWHLVAIVGGLIGFGHSSSLSGVDDDARKLLQTDPEVDLASLSNIALDGVATQSSTCYGGNAQRANDGNTNGSWRSGSVTHTCSNAQPWWNVQLSGNNNEGTVSETARIFAVTIYNRNDCCSNRLSDAWVDVMASDGSVVATEELGDMAQITERTVYFGGAEGVLGTSVKVSRNGGVLSLAEVQVFGLADAISCPLHGSSALSTTGGALTLSSIGTIGQLCTLTKQTKLGDEASDPIIVPLARSYDNEPWSNAAGEELPAGMLSNGFNCFSAGERKYCSVYLPPLDVNEVYVLTTYEHSLSERDQVSRFLSQATFGVTTEDLNDPRWVGGSNSTTNHLPFAFASWVQEQMDTSTTPITSHREFFRRRANAPVPGSFLTGAVMDPCTSPSRWRTLAAGKKEWPGWNPTFDRIGNTTWYRVLFGGQFRTMLHESNMETFASDKIPVDFSNWEELFDGDITKMPYVVDLPEIGVDPSMDKIVPFNGPTSGSYLLRTPLGELPMSVGGLCDQNTNPNGIPRLEAFSSLGAIVGRLPSQNGLQWLIYDGHVDFRDNHIDNPLIDGGGKVKKESIGGYDIRPEWMAPGKNTALCANAPRTFLNSQGCKLSFDENACRGDTFVDDGKAVGSSSDGILVCGSPGEVSNDITFSHKDSFLLHGMLRIINPIWTLTVIRSVWSHLSIKANDQLRQRVAFALNQIFAVVRPVRESEPMLNYHDIFVRNAFGHWKDLLREVAYSPIMAMNLSYLGSKSMAYVKATKNQLSFADENFAREVMQLFNIGTVLLNEDGTLQRDENGDEIDAYSNLDIMNFARAWTGFAAQKTRGNFEADGYTTMNRPLQTNSIDPMRIVPEYRDKFPKTNLIGGYIGDTYPLCKDLPPKAFLNKGAMYRFIGGSKLPESMQAKPEYLEDDSLIEFELSVTSQLREVLCEGAGVDCKSQPPSNEVVLPSSTLCDSLECHVDTVRVVRVAEGRYWEYIRQPCVELAFFEDGKELGLKQRGPNGPTEVAVCANPSLPVAFEACCGLPSPTDGPTCEQCSDNNACTKDLCDESGECSNVAFPWCSNGAIIEYWYNVNFSGGDYSALYMFTALKNDARYPKSPDKTVLLDNTLEGMRDGDWYGARMRTYVTAPRSGNYRFWIRGDDFTELWGGSNPQELTMIAHAYRWTTSFDTVASQASAYIELVAGESYYLEALMIEKRGGDGIAVAWDCAECGISREVIPASHTRQTSNGDGDTAQTLNVYDDERVTYATATARCLAQGGNGQCDYSIIGLPTHKTGYHWTNNTCNNFIKVSSDETTPGWIALVHEASSSVLQHVDETSLNFFSVVWDNGMYPNVNDMCAGVNGAIMEYWYGMDFSSGLLWSALKDDPRFPSLPDKTVILDETLEAFRDGDKYGARMRTYVTAPKSGNYRFWIRGDDYTELWLSTSADPEGLNLIAYANRWTTSFDTVASQASAYIELVAGESYYLEAYLLDGGGADSIAVAWDCAECGISREVIPASHTRQTYSGCEVIEDGCFCPTTVSDSIVYYAMPTSVENVLSTLFIGAVDPSTTGVSYESETDSTTGIIAHKIGAAFDEHTVFEVYDVWTGRVFFLRNIMSTVNIGSSYSFRNAPHFMSMIPSETDSRDAEHETEAVLDSYLFHRNTAPFLARLLIQRFNIASNPAPAYVLAVATAFRSGSYSVAGTQFGSGKYGDLSATIAAILLCPDAVSATLDADPAAGSLRQPLLKVIAMMRNLNLVGTSPDQIHAISPGLRIGQSPYDYESVFSHFHNDFVTGGRGAEAGLFAPEEMAIDLPRVIETLNGFFGTVYSYGYNSRYGFGAGWAGVLSWNPTSGISGVEVVDEMSTLLTAGRLSKENREIIHQAYSQNGKEVALQLIASTAEFHTTNQVVTKSGNDRLTSIEAPSNENNASDYKAIIYMDLIGGVDSYNMLVPMHCEGSNIYDSKYNMTVDEQYYDIRKSIALDKASLHQINSGGGQPCTQFGLHPSLPKLADLYRGEEALFFANIGYLTDPPPIRPKGLTFGHSSQTQKIASNDGYRVHGHSGVLGRIRDTVQASHKTSAIYVKGGKSVLEGERGVSSLGPIAVGVDGIQVFPKNIRNAANIPNFMAQVKSLNNASMPDSGWMAEAWSSSMHESFSVLDEVGTVQQVATATDFPIVFSKVYNPLADQLRMVSRLQQAALQRGVTRDFYSVEYGSWDHHGGVLGPQEIMFKVVDDALAAYVAEAKAIGVWESTVLVQVSEFGRTMYPNGNDGTDHGWAGHYFAIGGQLKGGRILGKYPQSIPRTLRHSPTSPWDSVWFGIAEWAGSDNLAKVCPHKHRFEETDMFNAATMFRATGPTLSPSLSPSKSPTAQPTTVEPSLSPSKGPSKVPTSNPTTSPTTSALITSAPVVSVTSSPTNTPVLPAIASFPYQHIQVPYDDISTRLTLLYQDIGNNGFPADVFPLGQCQGDCDNDSECQSGLVCKQRRNFEVVPGCEGGDFDQGTDYCMSRLGQCQGNCAGDFDCEAGMVCKQRSNFEVVAGCEGGDLLDQDTNYCQLKLGQCQGNCVSSEDCQAGLICRQGTIFERPASCDGGDFDLSINYCYARPHDTYLWELGNNGFPASVFPLPVCAGDCDSDAECAGELKCFQRGAGSYQPVPGCEGVGLSGEDYCFDPLTQTS